MTYRGEIEEIENNKSKIAWAITMGVFDGDEMIVNGPSITPQLLPSGSSQYKNITSLATIDSSVEGAELLVDGIINTSFDLVEVRELIFDSKTKVTFEFDTEVEVKAIMVYDSASYALSLDSYKLEFSKDGVDNVHSNSKYKYIDEFGYEIKYAAAANIIQFESIKTNKVTFTFPSGVAISEIIIVGGSK